MKITLDSLAALPIRDAIGPLLNSCGLTGRAAEIGVLWGGFMRIVLHEWRGDVYYAVDPWERQSTDVYREKTDAIDYEQCYRQVRDMAKADNRIIMLRGFSVDMAKALPNETLDWVFIDGNHSARAVLDDMDWWFMKLKPGGVFSGHDYGDDTNYPNFCEVKTAVDRWMKEHGQRFVIDKHGSSWWSIKP